jgi:hypothetical protein
VRCGTHRGTAKATRDVRFSGQDFLGCVSQDAAVAARIGDARYAWLNSVQCVGKMLEVQKDSYVKYDIFVVRRTVATEPVSVAGSLY